MSEQNPAANVTTNADKTGTGKAKAKRTNARTDFDKIIGQHAKRRGISHDRAAKELRAKARREFDRLVKLDPALAKAKTRANDGNRWPALNANAAKHLLTSKRAQS